jgi:N-formylglutamate amidohydrolase
MRDVYTLKSPEKPQSCVVFNSPHSGSEYSDDFLASTKLDSLAIRSSEDAFVDELFMDAPKYGAHLLAARAPRAFIDLNRDAVELDSALIRDIKRAPSNPRIAAGLGVIPRVVGNGQVIRTGKMPLIGAQDRIARYYTPYHSRLHDLIKSQREQFGMAILLDCHSMPQKALDNGPLVRGKVPDIVLGDRYGAACDRWIVDLVSQVFSAAGFVVARNQPFSGGYITQHYGRPTKGVHAIQIEINRALYMNEKSVERSDDFESFRETLSGVTRKLVEIGPTPIAVAAE